VFLADDLRRACPVALKVLRPELRAVLTLQRFLREIDVASHLEHANILPVIESGEAGGQPYYVMPYVAGGSLHDVLAREGALPFERVFAIGRAVAAALDYAHAQQIVHRDIKPANILFENDLPLIADFGIACALSAAGSDRLTESGISVGTPPYMSPEQGGGAATLDGRSDVYSLACVVFEMITGEVPFSGASATAIIAKHMQAAPPDLGVLRPTATVEMQRVMERALAKQPADRFATAGAFVQALEQAFGGTTARRRWLTQLAMAAGVLVMLGAASLWAIRQLGAPSSASVAARPGPRDIAVLYFDDLTPDKRVSHIAAGLTEDLIDRLSQVSTLHVVSPAGVRVFRDSVLSFDTLAQRLRIGTLVTGSVAASGPLLRLKVRLVDAATGNELRSQTIERPTWDLFELQDSVSSDVALWLRERIGQRVQLTEQRAQAPGVAAWEALQRAEALYQAEDGNAVPRASVAAAEKLARTDSRLPPCSASRRNGRSPSFGARE
jgi:serine/threonine protein kinase